MFININKPSGWTSSDVVQKLKHYLGLKKEKIGHLGTLDPLATGVLPIAIGKSTRLFDIFLSKTKSYLVDFEFGKETDTLDSTGVITKLDDVNISIDELKVVVASFKGKHLQIPPKFSAKKINGRRAYDLARDNVNFELTPKEIEIFDIKLIKKLGKNKFQMLVSCSSGTYIRSLCRDIAKKMHTVAIMTALIRTRAGAFNIKDSVSLESFLDGNKQYITTEQALSDITKVQLDNKFLFDLKNGKKVVFTAINDLTEPFVLYCGDILFGIAEQINGEIKIKINLLEEM